MERIRFYIDNVRQMTIVQSKDENGKFSVSMSVENLDEDQAKNVFDYLMRPFFVESGVIKPHYIPK